MANRVLDTVLLLALPASGKSEVRRYLEHVSPEARANEFHMGPNIQLDDFPYVHLMRRIDDELVTAKSKRMFFHSSARPFKDPREWGTLVALLNEDYDRLLKGPVLLSNSAAETLFDRIDRAFVSVGGKERLSRLDKPVWKSLVKALEPECREFYEERNSLRLESLEGKTVVLEFARGGPQYSSMPLPDFYGYRYSLSQLSHAILEKAAILYIWVTPEESRRKNQDRSDPNDPGSILHHGVPIDVMLNDYGCDDMDWLESMAKTKGTVMVEAHGRTYHVPIARFDNRVDKTSFLRTDPVAWDPVQVRAVHESLRNAFGQLASIALK